MHDSLVLRRDKRWRRKETETVIHSDNDFATVAYLRIKEAGLDEKESSSYPTMRLPPLLSEPYEDIIRVLQSTDATTPFFDENEMHIPNTLTPNEDRQLQSPIGCELPPNSMTLGHWVVTSSLRKLSTQALTIPEEVRHCFSLLQGISPYPRCFSICPEVN